MRACAAAAPSRNDARNVGRDLAALAGALALQPQMISQVIEAGLIVMGEGCTSGIVTDQEIERFRETYVTLPELSATYGLSGSRAVLSVLEKAGVPATCRRPTFCSFLFPRGEAVDALRAWSRMKDALRPLSGLPAEQVLSVRDAAVRLGTDRNMVLKLISNKHLASTWQGQALMVPLSDVERFSRTYVFANELARLAGRTHGSGVGAAVTKVLVRNGLRPAFCKPKFVSYVFVRDEAIEAVGRLNLQ